MTRNEIINGLEREVKSIRKEPQRKMLGIFMTVDEAEDIITLLKEQEAVEPEVEVLNEIDRSYRCPKCHKCFFYKKQKYCDLCGQAVTWE